MLSNQEHKALEIFACEIRKYAIDAITSAGSGHIGGMMSIAETLAVLYGKQMRYRATDPKWEDRDRFVLSKGHAGPALYAALALKGFFPVEQLRTLNRGGTMLPSHCDRNKTPGVDFSSGSLGNGLAVAAGSALGARVTGKDYYTYCIVGDGEMDEGEIWESILFSAQFKIGNLIAFFDVNHQQIDGYTNQVCDLGDVGRKLKEFNWHVQCVNGHDVAAIDATIDAAKACADRPSAIVLDTVKGKGCMKAEAAGMCHHMAFSEADRDAEWARLDARIAELRAE